MRGRASQYAYPSALSPLRITRLVSVNIMRSRSNNVAAIIMSYNLLMYNDVSGSYGNVVVIAAARLSFAPRSSLPHIVERRASAFKIQRDISTYHGVTIVTKRGIIL